MDAKINSLARKTALEIYGHKSEADLRYWGGVEADKKVAAAAAIIETALADLSRQLAQSEERVAKLEISLADYDAVVGEYLNALSTRSEEPARAMKALAALLSFTSKRPALLSSSKTN